MNPFRWFKLWVAGRSRLSACWLGMHRWDMPGGHCEKCGLCDQFFHEHVACGWRRGWFGSYRVKL